MAESVAAPVGLNVQRRDPLERLSSLLSVQRSRTALQVEQQEQRQKAALAKYDWNKHVGADGTIDVPSLNDPELMAAAGDQYQNVVQSAISTRERQLAAQQSLVNLRSTQRTEFAAMMNALRSDPDIVNDTPAGRQKVTQAMVNFGEIHGEDVLPVLSSYAPFVQNSPPGRLKDTLRNIGLQGASVESQISAQQPILAQTGARQLDINPLSPTSGLGLANELGPGAEILTDAKGAQFVFNRQTNTVTPVGQGGERVQTPPTAAPTAPTFTQPRYQGQAADVERFSEDVANVRAAADQAPTQRTVLKHILDLSTETSTGPLASYLQETKIGGQFFGDNYQELGKYLERNALSAMSAMGGPPSDARLSAAVAANGSTRFNPEALRAVTEFNYAANSGLEAYRNGMDQAVGLEKPDYTQLARFKADWAKNFDIDAFRLENAIEDGDKEAADSIKKSLSPSRLKELAEKMENLDSLSETGRLP